MIDKIVFGILKPEFIKKMAVAKLSKTDLYDQEGYPIEGGLMDPRMGVIDPGLRCRTCGGTVGECEGHFGYLELTRPVINVHYAKFIYTILKVSCEKCGRVLLDDESKARFMVGKKSLKKLKRLSKRKCPYCDKEQAKVKLLKPTTMMVGSKILTPLKVREWLEQIPDEDLKYLGLRNIRPEWMIITLLPISPVTVRPSITLETGERSEDDLTHKLVDIVRINKRLRENIDLGAPDFIIDDLWELVQYHVSTYLDNELTGVPPARHRSGRILKTLIQRLKTKEGRFRQNLIGKRVNYSARTVISPDPMLDIEEVGVPLFIAKELTIPVVVNDKNIKHLKKLIKQYPNWPTINYVIKPDGRRKKVSELNKKNIAEELAPGYKAEKQLEDGDWTLFNRQPSLHRMSLMGHKVKVMPHKTFRMNLAVCPAYNADFDGDEMNLHVPQTQEAQAETKLLTRVATQIRSPRFSGPIIGCDKDHISGLYVLTHRYKKLPRKDAIELVRFCDQDMKIPKKSSFTGKEIFSLFLPKDFNIEYKSSKCRACPKCKKKKCPYDAYVKIKNGKLLSGTIDKKGMAVFSGQILDKIDKKYGHMFTKDFLFKVTKLSLKALTDYGFSVSISDTDLDKKTIDKTEKIIKKAEKEVKGLIKSFKKGKIKPLVGRTSKQTLEIKVRTKIADSLNKIAAIVEKEEMHNTTYIMSTSGARGNLINYIQSAVTIGQETIKGQRIKIGYHRRTFPHFKRGDISLESKGHVKSSYKQGLNPFEFFFDAMNGREGLMDKSLKTRHSGYLERRLVGALKDLKVEYDRTIRDSSDKIIQFVAGEDGVDPSKVQKGGIDVEKIADEI